MNLFLLLNKVDVANGKKIIFTDFQIRITNMYIDMRLATQAIDHALITNSDVRTEHGHGDYNI